MPLRTLAAAAALLAAGSAGAATVIGFEEFGNVGLSGPVVDTQYPGVTFSSTPGENNLVSSQSGIGFGTNFLCTGTSFIDCVHETLLDFSAPVSGLSFYAVGSNDSGDTAKVDVFVNGAFAATQLIHTNGIFNVPDLVDLTAFNNVTRIRIYDITDGGGLGWDNFSFSAAVPEPSSYLLMLAGVSLLASGLRRRRA